MRMTVFHFLVPGRMNEAELNRLQMRIPRCPPVLFQVEFVGDESPDVPTRDVEGELRRAAQDFLDGDERPAKLRRLRKDLAEALKWKADLEKAVDAGLAQARAAIRDGADPTISENRVKAAREDIGIANNRAVTLTQLVNEARIAAGIGLRQAVEGARSRLFAEAEAERRALEDRLGVAVEEIGPRLHAATAAANATRGRPGDVASGLCKDWGTEFLNMLD
jgi:hypothetical protein